ncbi:NAD-dependent epimerase/dehydratase family protein [Arthrobacter sp. MA-N2]|uniref:NAD-dependent epimerase/dehydratase family protein n=1 Tax=Arthrobacter sp. MA-N2 TaxID=1101188 RepID=UPI0004BAC6F3|nr:NAD(P)-dependent oxidoreductase [Arthrobacter sp. MA-N2]
MPTVVDRPPRILVLGSSGFIGSRVVASLSGSGGAHVVALSRSPVARRRNNNVIIAAADISVPGSLIPFLANMDVVVHAASYVGSDRGLAREVNERGTGNLIEQCQQAGVRRVIYVSTCSVYGTGPHRGLRESEADYHPASVTSASRAVAERMILGYGGEVVRPNLVFGAGDRWFVPGLLRIIKVAGGWPGDGSALLSIISAEALGRLVSGLALAPRQSGQAFHAAYPEPVPVSTLLQSVAEAFGMESPRLLGDDERASEALRTAGFSRHQLALVTKDHWYSSQGLWRTAGHEQETFGGALADFCASYRASPRQGRS